MARHPEAIVDASVAIKWFNLEEGTQAALRLREEHIEETTILCAPNLILYELTNALRYNPSFNKEKVTQAISSLIDLQIDFISPSKDLLDQSIKDAYLYDITVYDSNYLALAELMGIILYTSDKKLYEKTKETGIIELI